MGYSSHYALADGCVSHMETIVPSVTDPLIRGQYAGFAAVVGVTVYELAIKEIFTDFARKKNRVFGDYIEAHFERLNGRIKLDSIKNEHIKRFGPRYVVRFNRLLDQEETRELLTSGKSIKSSYGNLITWRHEFAHEGRPPANATFSEVYSSYNIGKFVIDALARAMVR